MKNLKQPFFFVRAGNQKRNEISFIFVLSLLLLSQIGCSESNSVSTRTPVIYSTDLFHPHDDPDDHFDILSLYAIRAFDIKAVILDQGLKQDERPGDVPLKQLNSLFGKNIISGKGLALPLNSPNDKALDQQAQYQQGVDLLVYTLKQSSQPVTVISVGSLRDIAAAWNRFPQLLREKIKRLYCFIGEASLSSFKEYNVELDQHAFVSIMNSGLPIYWVPCFDGGLWKNDGSASYWQTKQRHILEGVSNEVINFFRFALLEPQRVVERENFKEPIRQEQREKLYRELRNLWGAAVFVHAAGIPIIEKNGHWFIATQQNKSWSDGNRLFTFEAVRMWVGTDGVVYYDNSEKSHEIYRFKVVDRVKYQSAMTEITNDIYRNIKIE